MNDKIEKAVTMKQAADADRAEAQGIYHFVCDQCEHTWWSNAQEAGCIWGCPSGHAVRM